MSKNRGEPLGSKYKPIMKLLTWMIFIGYSTCLIYWMFRGFGRSSHAELRFNYIPFTTIWSYIMNVNQQNITTTIVNLVGNIGVFVPFGVLMPSIFKHLRKYPVFSIYFISSILILEFMQTFLKVGSGDIDDVILNFVGGSIGYLLWLKTKINA
ncbi:VanZ family protein [Paenibacillus sp. FSL K6-2524]|uniref:VanZ family protein n=1 Tax=Paenibacillus sp. FSL K6-2524 TaxID=2954516 RepID=UPI0030F7CB62